MILLETERSGHAAATGIRQVDLQLHFTEQFFLRFEI